MQTDLNNATFKMSHTQFNVVVLLLFLFILIDNLTNDELNTKKYRNEGKKKKIRKNIKKWETKRRNSGCDIEMKEETKNEEKHRIMK